MSDAIDPPQIWQYDEAAAVNTEAANMKEYKPVGSFYADAASLCAIYGLKLHPIFRAPAISDEDGAKAKEPTTISCQRYRLDPNSMKALFKVLEGCPHVQTLK